MVEYMINHLPEVILGVVSPQSSAAPKLGSWKTAYGYVDVLKTP